MKRAVRVVGACAGDFNAVMIVYPARAVHVDPARVQLRFIQQAMADARGVVEEKAAAVLRQLIADADHPVALGEVGFRGGRIGGVVAPVLR